jgi:putative hydrolase of the HAD superfamily
VIPVRFSTTIRAIFFDAVGTLIHPSPSAAEVYSTVGRRFGSHLDQGTVARRFAQAFQKQEEQDCAEALRTGEERERARWRAIVADVLDDVHDPERCFQSLYDHFARADAWRADPDAAGVLQELAGRGYQLGICSNFDGRLRCLVTALPALRPVQHVVISSEVGWRKPAQAFFRQLPQRVGLPPAQVLVVGDDPVNDFEGAQAAGLEVLLFDPHGKETAPVACRLTSLRELVAVRS